jgi:hypothetical protein
VSIWMSSADRIDRVAAGDVREIEHRLQSRAKPVDEAVVARVENGVEAGDQREVGRQRRTRDQHVAARVELDIVRVVAARPA